MQTLQHSVTGLIAPFLLLKTSTNLVLKYFRILKVGPIDNTLQLSTVNIIKAKPGN